MTLYDYAYIDDKIIGTVEKNLPNVAEILKKVEIRATGKATSALSQSTAEEGKLGDTGHMTWESEENQKKQPTQQIPFNLTKPKPKVIPQPEPIKKEIKANPVPKNLFKKTLADIEKEKEERRQEKINNVKQQYEGSSKQKFPLITEKRPNKFDKVKEEYIKTKE